MALALTPGLRTASRGPVQRLLASAVEHASVLSGGRFASKAVAKIDVTRSGVVDLDHLRRQLAAGSPALVSIMAANNETGALQPVAEAAELVHAAGGLLHVDAIQALGRTQLNINAIGADLVTLSAHKIGGPKGVGALVVAKGVSGLEPLLRGGGQELGHRAGTENVAGIVGFAAAVRAAMAARDAETAHMELLQKRLEQGLRQTIAVSSGSACSSGKVQPSHVLQAMGFIHQSARGAVRLSLGWSTSEAEIDSCVKAWRKLASTLLKGCDETLLERF